MRDRIRSFVTVGAIGFVIQTGLLAVLTTKWHWPYALATAVAVELAILHNFWWHERWTWRDRSFEGGTLQRLARFHIGTGSVSMTGNLVVTTSLVEYLHVVPVAANIAAVAFTSIATFLMADRWVFLRAPLACVTLMLVCASPLSAAELNAQTLEAWRKQTADAQVRLRQDRPSPSTERGTQGEAIRVPGGIIHVWRGSTVVHNATVDQLLTALTNPGTPPPQEDVLESRVLARSDTMLRVYLRLRRTAIVTVLYDTEHEVSFRRISADWATSESVATKIAESDGRDRGFLWRLNSYWRYIQTGNHVLVELQSLSLSRDIPLLVRPIAAPIVNSIARESMTRTLEALSRFVESAGANGSHGHASRFEAGPQPSRQEGGVRCIAMDAKRVGLEWNGGPIHCDNLLFGHDPDGAIDDSLRFVNHRSGLRPRSEGPVSPISAIGEALGGDLNPRLASRSEKLRSWWAEYHQG